MEKVRQDLSVEFHGLTNLGISNDWVYDYFLKFLTTWKQDAEQIKGHSADTLATVILVLKQQFWHFIKLRLEISILIFLLKERVLQNKFLKFFW